MIMLRLLVLTIILIPYASAVTVPSLKHPPPQPPRWASPNDPDRPKDWFDVADRGERYYKEWENKRGDDAPFPSHLKDIFLSKPDENKEMPCGMEDTLYEADHYVYQGDFVRFDSKYPDDGVDTTAQFSSFISVEDGMFIVSHYDRGIYFEDFPFEDVTTTEIAWYQWCTQYLNVHPHTQDDFSALSSYWIFDVDDPESLEILDFALKGLDPGRYVFRPDDHPFFPNKRFLSNPFWAILGSPSGGSIIFLLTDYKNAMGHKGIKEIWVVVERYTRASASYHMEAVFESPS